MFQFHREGNLYFLGIFIGGIFGGFLYFLLGKEIQGFLIFKNAIFFYVVIFYVVIWVLISVFILQFFRKPFREILTNENAIFAPCDGEIVVIEKVWEDEYLKKECLQISIFMSPLNVHSNHNPITGEVTYFKYHAGKFLVAWHPKSSTENERTTYVIKHAKKGEILLRQIAGAVARRIKWYIKPQQQVKQNEEFGFIKFGSRVDIFLPIDAKILISLHQKTLSRKTILAEW